MLSFCGSSGAHSFGEAASSCVDSNCLTADEWTFPRLMQVLPAPGIDPTTEELAGISTLAQIFAWLGTAEPARQALCASLGGGSPRLRDVVYIKGSDWDNAVANVSIAVPDNDPCALTPLEVGHMAMLRRICRLRLGLRAVEDSGLQAVGLQAGGLDLGAPLTQSSTSALPSSAPPTSTSDPKLKLSIILDPSLDSDLIRLPHSQVRGLFNA